MTVPLAPLLMYLPALLLSVVAHEYAHARVAVAQGDPTPAAQGRLTWDPRAHLDPVGSLLVPLVLWFGQAGFLFGWARPVQVDPTRFRDGARGDILVSLAGVGMNLVLAVAFVGVVVATTHLSRFVHGGMESGVGVVIQAARFGVLFNLLLAVFNLLPIPPLDGSHVVQHLLPEPWRARYRSVARYGVLLLVAAFLVPGVLRILLRPVWLLDGVAETLIRLLV